MILLRVTFRTSDWTPHFVLPMRSADSPPPADASASPRSWIVSSLIAVVAIVALTAWGLAEFRRMRLSTQSKSLATYQIRAAFDQFLLENPTRLFVRYEELIGPDRYVKGVNPRAGEDYHELFPLRRGTQEFAITLGSGHRVSILETDGTIYGMIVQRPNGEFAPREND